MGDGDQRTVGKLRSANRPLNERVCLVVNGCKKSKVVFIKLKTPIISLTCSRLVKNQDLVLAKQGPSQAEKLTFTTRHVSPAIRKCLL